jgi:hypothetical protein
MRNCLSFSLCLGACQRPSKGTHMIKATRSPELVEYAREGRRRFEAADSAWLAQTTAFGDVSSFGTAPEEQARGRDNVLALTIEQIREMNEAAGLAITATDNGQGDEDVIEAYEAGDTGWIVTHGRFTFDDGTWVANRVVNVVVRDREDGNWKSVLTTSQILVPNELLEDGSPLRSAAGA